MFIFLALVNRATNPYWASLRRQLAEGGIAPLTIGHAPNIFGHPVGIAILVLSGNFLLPKDPTFFLYWALLIAVVAVGTVLVILGLLNTKFFTAQVIGSLGFVSSSIWAAVVLGERMTVGVVAALVLAVAGVIFFSWKKSTGEIFQFDRGMVYTTLAVVLAGAAAVLYKLATIHTSSYGELFTGRFLGDMVAWTAAWLISLWVIRRNPARDLAGMMSTRAGIILVAGTIITTSMDTVLIHKLSVTTLAIVGTISFPVTYFFSYFKYRERISLGMWLGTACILASIAIYLLFK